jgi:hypothetical protein
MREAVGMGSQLDFYAAARAGQTAVVRRVDGAVVGWLVRGGDGLLRVKGRGEVLGDDVAGSPTVPSAMAEFARRRGWHREP